MDLALKPRPFLVNPFFDWLRGIGPAVVRRAPVAWNRHSGVHEFARNGTLSIARPGDSVVECLQGCVWITLDGDVRDVFLQPGESFRPDRNRHALIQALEWSCVRVTRAG